MSRSYSKRRSCRPRGTCPGRARHIALAATETLAVLSWAFLLNAVIRLISPAHIAVAPFCYIAASALVSWLECSDSPLRLDPLRAFGMSEIDHRERRPSPWRTMIRIMATPLCLLPAGLGFFPIAFYRRSLPEVVSGTRIIELDRALDPRRGDEIERDQRRSLSIVLLYTSFSAIIAVLAFLVPVRIGPGKQVSPTPRSALPAREGELLAEYLELKAIYPDSLEFHVRLACLYYRNDMQEDLRRELEEIHAIDPEHPILVLGEDLDLRFEDLVVETDTLASRYLASDSTLSVYSMDLPSQPADSMISAQRDSTAEDSTASIVVEDSVQTESVEDSIVLDTIPDLAADTALTSPDIVLPPDTAASDSVSAPDSINLVVEPSTPADSTPTFEPDTVQTE